MWGIACEIYDKEIDRLKILNKKKTTSFDGFSRSLPPHVANAFGITETTELYVNYLITEEKLSAEDIAVELIERFELLGRPVPSYKNYTYEYPGD